MIDQRADRLSELARTDPAVAPLALLQIEALRTADSSWERGVPVFSSRPLTEGLPALEGMTLSVDSGSLSKLWRRLWDVAAQGNVDDVARQRSAGLSPSFDLLSLVEASITADSRRLEEICIEAGLDVGLLATMAHFASLPILLACGRKAAAVVSAVEWQAGYCPVCTAWPVLSEIRGLERERWLRCGRCATAWPFRQLVCVFCGNPHHRTQGYLAGEKEREARRVETCDRCRGYLKAMTTLGPLSPADVLAHDLSTVELDLAAIDQGYARAEACGSPLHVSVERRTNGWMPWKA